MPASSTPAPPQPIRIHCRSTPTTPTSPPELSLAPFPVHPVGSDHEDFLDQGLVIPYYALNFQPTNYAANYMLAFSAQVMIDGQLVAQSPANMFPFRW